MMLLITLSDGNIGSNNDVNNNQSSPSTSRRIPSTDRSKGILDTEPPASIIW
jgi:hypothetical protein